MNSARTRICALALATATLAGCAAPPAPRRDDSAFRLARPATLLVLPPLDDSMNVEASPALWASATRPLAEAGYYVMPAVLVAETLRRNGVETPHDAQEIPPEKLRRVFAADAAVYIEVKRYGTRYALVSSSTDVEVAARLVDLRSGTLLWAGTARASSRERDAFADTPGSLVGVLATSALRQIADTASDASFSYARAASARLFDASSPGGLLAGPKAR